VNRLGEVGVAADLQSEGAGLQESIRHDYSTSETGIVPLNRRRPLWHFAGLWTTFAAGFSYLFVGGTAHDAGFTLAELIGAGLLAIVIYVAYAMLAAYLGSRTGQTHSLLTRSIFGKTGSWLVSLFLVIGPLGWVGFQAGLMVQIWNGLYGWSAVELLTIIFAAVMIFNNLFGFTGISAFARYLVTPLIMLWVFYLIIKVLATNASVLGHTPKVAVAYTFWQIVGVFVGFLMWGNEPDIWRYGKPAFWWPLPAFAWALVVGFMLFVIGGWTMAEIAGSTVYGTVIQFTTNYSLFGFFWLAWFLATVSQFALNDANYYEAINGIQNLFGGWRQWRRLYACLICAALGAVSGYLVNYAITNGFFKVAAFLAISVPCATVIMVADHYVLPRIFQISRPLNRVPAWPDTAVANWPALVALIIAVAFGGYATGIMPGEDPNRYWGPAPLLAWILAGGLYIIGVAVTRMLTRDVKSALGFPGYSGAEAVTPGSIVDITTGAAAAGARAS
jgi:purine-cytosine permease-like protein